MSVHIEGFLHAADAIVECRACGATYGEPCKPQPKDKGKLLPGYVHIGRRVKRLMLTARRWWERDKIENELTELLAKELKGRKN
jgi:hypothetical protein